MNHRTALLKAGHIAAASLLVFGLNGSGAQAFHAVDHSQGCKAMSMKMISPTAAPIALSGDAWKQSAHNCRQPTAATEHTNDCGMDLRCVYCGSFGRSQRSGAAKPPRWVFRMGQMNNTAFCCCLWISVDRRGRN
jgi:hypothetical protein